MLQLFAQHLVVRIRNMHGVVKNNYYQSSQKSIEDLMVEVSNTDIQLQSLMQKALHGDSVANQHNFASVELTTLMKMLSAAKDGLGLANKLKDQQLNKYHRGKVLGNLNRIRAKIRNTEKALI